MAEHQLSERNNGEVVDAHVGDSIELCLNEVASGGYRWMLESDGGAVLDASEPSYEFAPGEVGGRSIARFRFTVSSGGRSALRLGYRRPWESDAAPLAIYQVTIAAR